VATRFESGSNFFCEQTAMPTANELLDFSDINALHQAVGSSIGASQWFQIEQHDIDAFGTLTKDPDAMHMDPVWAGQNSPYGSTIAYGFQTLSMMTAMLNDLLPRGSSEAYKINYGFDRVRLMSPVRVGKRIRGVAHLKGVRPRGADQHIITVAMNVEIEGEDRPAAVCDWLFMVVNAESEARRPDMPTSRA